MFDFIPIYFYTPLFYYACLIVVILTCIFTVSRPLNDRDLILYLKVMGTVFFVSVLFYMGFRPVHRVFTDMVAYSNVFERYKYGIQISGVSDIGFHMFTKLSSQIMSYKFYFLICAGLYMIPLLVVCKKWFKNYWFYAFLMLTISFSFWAYGTNGIRNGIAGSFFLLGVSRNKRFWQIAWIVLAISFHKSMLLPTVGYVLSQFYNNPKQFIFFWIVSIPLSLVGGGLWENIFANLGVEDHRINYFTIETDVYKFSKIGFRWDFLLYSATAVFFGWYYIMKKKFKDRIYYILFNTYVFTNAFWILVIRANYTNRFAYLSWFMMALVVVYPLLKERIFQKHNRFLAGIILIYFSFTFFMNVVIA